MSLKNSETKFSSDNKLILFFVFVAFLMILFKILTNENERGYIECYNFNNSFTGRFEQILFEDNNIIIYPENDFPIQEFDYNSCLWRRDRNTTEWTE